jgi:hypothetical protein
MPIYFNQSKLCGTMILARHTKVPVADPGIFEGGCGFDTNLIFLRKIAKNQNKIGSKGGCGRTPPPGSAPERFS